MIICQKERALLDIPHVNRTPIRIFIKNYHLPQADISVISDVSSTANVFDTQYHQSAWRI